MMAKDAAKELGLEEHVKEGVYAMNGGPSYESVAECKMLKALGADVVGEYVNVPHSSIWKDTR